MTENPKEKKTEVTLKSEDKKLLHSVIDAAKGLHAKKETKPEPKPHWKAEDLLKEAEDCPTCHGEIEKLTLAGIAKVRKQRESKPFACSTCGTGVDETEKECILCGGLDAKQR